MKLIHTRKTLMGLTVVLMILLFYMIFNTGNPAGLQRLFVGNPQHDTLLLGALSLLFFLVNVLLINSGSLERTRQLLLSNAGHIENLKKKGLSDNQIADSFLGAMKGSFGLFRHRAKKRVLILLDELS